MWTPMGVKNHWEIQKKQKKQNVETYGWVQGHRSPHFVFLFVWDFPMAFHPHWSPHFGFFVFLDFPMVFHPHWSPHFGFFVFFLFPNGFSPPLVSTFCFFWISQWFFTPIGLHIFFFFFFFFLKIF